eukprot:Skav213328  [mRNA]  locus=scaffold3340:152987:153990:- [translate_table: standard]
MELKAGQDAEHHCQQGDQDVNLFARWGQVQNQGVLLAICNAKGQHAQHRNTSVEKEGDCCAEDRDLGHFLHRWHWR